MYRFWGYLWGAPPVKEETPIVKFVIGKDELLNVKLRPVSKERKIRKIKKPALARNMPCSISNFHLLKLNRNQMKEILNVKLKHIDVPDRKTSWDTPHPVLRELLTKVPVC